MGDDDAVRQRASSTLSTGASAELDPRGFLVADAVRSGVSRGQLRGPSLGTPFYGIRVPADAFERGDASRRDLVVARANAYAAGMDAEHCFSHQTAAAILGLPLPWRLEKGQTLHVLSRSASARRGGAGVTGHHSRDESLTVCTFRGLQIVSPVSVWHQLAPVLSVDELVVLGDALLRRTKPLATLAELAASVDARSGRRGSRALREAIALVRPRTDSAKESECRLLLMRAGLPEPIVNAAILDEAGGFVAFGDLVYPEYKVLVEYDGGQHRDDVQQFHRDIDRLDALMALGWRVLRFNKSHLRDSAIIVERTRQALSQRGWRP